MANEEDECLLVESSLSMNAAMVSIGGSGSYGEWSRVGGTGTESEERERERETRHFCASLLPNDVFLFLKGFLLDFFIGDQISSCL